jgi:hypothetical protein
MSYYDDDDSSEDYGYSDHEPHCDECDRTFVNERALAQHDAARHRFECDRCTRMCRSARALDEHNAAFHAHQCGECGRNFTNANNLAQHAQVHRARTAPCPGCGALYRGAADAVLHFETGRCPSCPGRDEARRRAYEFAAQNGGSGFLTRPLAITSGAASGGWQAAEDNYRCQVRRAAGSLSSCEGREGRLFPCKRGVCVRSVLTQRPSPSLPGLWEAVWGAGIAHAACGVARGV